MNTNTNELSKVPYEVITDKTIQNNDETFKLIIIGDTGKRYIPNQSFM